MRETPEYILGQSLDRDYLVDQIHHILRKVLPEHHPPATPLVQFSSCETPPFPLSIYMLCPYRQDAGKFFYEMVSGWLIPGRRIPIELFFVTDFKFHAMEKERYTVGEAVLRIKDQHSYHLIEQTMQAFQREMILGLRSPYHANRILEIKELSLDDKTALVREKIVQLLARFPQRIDYDIFSFLQQFIIGTPRSFKEQRSYRCLTRIVCVLYVYLHAIREKSEGKRYLYSKSIKVNKETPFGEKAVVGLFVALNFLHPHEVFEKSHLLKVVQRYVQGVKIVENSHFLYQPSGERILAFYLEIEKENGEDFTREELALLQKHLSLHLGHCIEQLVKPVFMPRNEEEVMRYIVTLSRQVQYAKDIPQVVISFEGQMEGEMLFTVVLVRPVTSQTKSIDQLVGNSQIFEIEKVKKIGFVRKKYPKEAVVLRARFAEGIFLREDHTVNLYKARQYVVREVEEIFGEIRDFNGGLLAKQMEVYSTLKEALQETGVSSPDYLENFFHSLYPVELKGIFPLYALVKFYLEFHEALFSRERLKVEKEQHHLIVMMVLPNPESRQAVVKRIEEFKIPPSHLIKLQMTHEGQEVLGYAFLSSNPLEMDIFVKAID